MIPGTQSDIVDTQAAVKKVQGKVLTNTKTFLAQEPVSQMRLSSDSIWVDPLPTEGQLIDYSSTLWDAFNADIAGQGYPEAYYEQTHAGFNVKQVLVYCAPNAGTEYYSFDMLDNSSNRVNNLILTTFGNYFLPKLWFWDGSVITKQVSPISGVYWMVDAGGYLYTGDQADVDYSTNGYYITAYVYTGTKLSSSPGGNANIGYDHLVIGAGGNTTSFTLSQTPDVSTLTMSVNGLSQIPTTDYTVSGNTVTWVSTDFTPEEGDFIEFYYTY